MDNQPESAIDRLRRVDEWYRNLGPLMGDRATAHPALQNFYEIADTLPAVLRLVDAAQTMVREYGEELAAHVAQHGNVAGSQHGATRRIEPLREAVRALDRPPQSTAR